MFIGRVFLLFFQTVPGRDEQGSFQVLRAALIINDSARFSIFTSPRGSGGQEQFVEPAKLDQFLRAVT